MGNIQSGSELFHLFPFMRGIRAVQVFILGFSKDDSADLRDEFTDGGAANQPVILQGGISLSSCQVSQGYCQFNPTSNGFLKLVINFLMRWRMRSLMRSKKAGGILTKLWYPGMFVCMRLARRLL